MKMLADRVLVRPDQAESKTASGIFIPDTAKEKTQTGVVVSCGPGKSKDEPIQIKEGDKVLFAKHAGSSINYNSEDYLIMREADVWAVLQ
jgi:chaperonin GroES